MFILYPDHSIPQREDLLKNQCIKKAMEHYAHNLQQSEIDKETRDLANDFMELQTIKETIANIKKEYAEKIANIEKRMEERGNRIKYGKKEISGIIYYIPNHAEGKVMGYDKFGQLISTRDMLPDERQGRMAFIESPVVPAPEGTAVTADAGDRAGEETVDADHAVVPDANADTAGKSTEQIQAEMDAEMPLKVDMVEKSQEQLQQENAAKNRKKKK